MMISPTSIGSTTRTSSHRASSLRSLHKSAGLTLIELMIGMVLGILLITGVLSIFTSNQQAFSINSDLAKLQESSRFAYEQMNREIRDTGTNPCGVRAVNTVVRAGGSIPWWGNWNGGTLLGHDGNEATGTGGVTFGTSTLNNRVTGTDAITILRTHNDDALLRSVTNHNTSTERFTLNSPHKFSAQDLGFVCDSSSGAIFEINNTSSAPAPSISYDVLSPSRNCSVALGWANNVDCNTNAVTKTFALGSYVTKFDPAIWYIGVNTAGGRSLYRETIFKQTSPSTTIGTERREFVPDVQDMQITYLMRTKSADPAIAPTLASTWVDASVINAQTGTWSATNLNEAVAVRIALTFQSDQKLGVNGTTTQALQRSTVAIISLRNREIVR